MKTALYRCNLCGKIIERQTLRPRLWLISYCDVKQKTGRIYRVKTQPKKISWDKIQATPQ